MAKLTKEQREFQRQRAKWEFSLSLWGFMNSFKSKEEPTVKLTLAEKLEVLLTVVHRNFNQLQKKETWQRD